MSEPVVRLEGPLSPASSPNPNLRSWRLSLARPRALNALSVPMLRHILSHIRQICRSSPSSGSLLLLRGDGRAFCAGGDVKAVIETATGSQSAEATSARLHRALGFFRREYRINHLLGTLAASQSQVGCVALLNGITMGGGVGLSVHSPFRVATENTVFAMPETQIGLFPDVGGTFFLPRLLRSPTKVGKVANDGKSDKNEGSDKHTVASSSAFGRFLGLTGWRLKGESVFFGGVATHFVPSAKLPELEQGLVQLAAEYQMKSSGNGWAQFLEQVSAKLNEYHQVEQPEIETNWEFGGPDGIERWRAMEHCFSAHSVEDIVDRLRTYVNKPGSENTAAGKFTRQCLALMEKMSPLSMKITLEQLDRGSRLSFKESFELELRLVQHVLYALQHPQSPLEMFTKDSSKLKSLYSHDFKTGVQALLIDKPPTTPQWMPPQLEQVSDELVQWYFDALPADVETTDDDDDDEEGSSVLKMSGKGPIKFLNDVDYHEYPVHFGLPDRRAVFDAYQKLSGGPASVASLKHVDKDAIYDCFAEQSRGSVDRQRSVRNMIDWVLELDFHQEPGSSGKVSPKL